MVGAVRAKMLFGQPEAAAVWRVILPAFFGMRRGAVGTIMTFALTFWALSDIGFEIGVVELWVVPHQAAFDTASIALHRQAPLIASRFASAIVRTLSGAQPS